MKFEDKLQSLRKKSNLSQEALAQELGVSRQAVSKWESGASYPEMDKLILMSKIFKCSLDDFVNEKVTDKDVIETEENKKIGYIDSIVNFIVKSVNMFCSMKFSSFLKCLFEMFMVGLVLGIISLIIGSIIYSLFYNISATGTFIDIILIFIYYAFFGILIIVDFIIFYQVYKVRYLDYYDQISYSKNQAKEYEVNEERQEKITDKNKRIKLNNNADRIIIRDPKDRPIMIFSILSKIVITIVKGFVLMFSAFLLIGIFFLIIMLGISIYLIFANRIFIGVTLCELCLSVLGIYFLIIMIEFLWNKKIKIMPFIITLISCVVIAGFSVSFILLNLKKFEIVKREYEVIMESVNIKYEDDLVISTLDWYNIDYEVDNNLKDIIVEYTYYKDIESVVYNQDSNTYHFSFYRFSDDDPIKIINEVIDNLKHNKIAVDDYQNVFSITVKGNQANIKAIIKNSSMKKHVTYFKHNGLKYTVNYDEKVGNDSYCTLNSLGYYTCYEVQNNSSCNVQLTD